MSVFGALKNYEISKYYTYTDLGTSAPLGMWMNLDVFNSLSPELQALFEEVSKETEAYHINLLLERKEGYIKTLKEAGVTFYTMSDADRAKWAELMPDIPAEWAEKMEERGWPGHEIVDTFMEITTKAGHKWPRQWGAHK
jgi:TRAP-type C4-dicarboxylate transport system substrate-binding protein